MYIPSPKATTTFSIFLLSSGLEAFSCIWPICVLPLNNWHKNEHELDGTGKHQHIIIRKWRVDFQPSVFWGGRILSQIIGLNQAKLSLWQQRRDVKSMCLGRQFWGWILNMFVWE